MFRPMIFIFLGFFSTISLANTCDGLLATQINLADAYIKDVLEELDLIESGQLPPDKTQTRIHLDTLNSLEARYRAIVEQGLRMVHDGDRKTVPYRSYEASLSSTTKSLIGESLARIEFLKKQPVLSRDELMYESIFFTSLFSSAKQVVEKQDLLALKSLTDKEKQLLLARLQLELKMESPHMTRNELFRFMKETAPFSFFFNRTSYGFPTFINLDERALLRLWGRNARPLGLNEDLVFADQRIAGYSPFEFLRHDNGHGLDQELQILEDGASVSRQVYIAVNEHLDNLETSMKLFLAEPLTNASRIQSTRDYFAQLVVFFYLLHEAQVPFNSLVKWSEGETVEGVRLGYIIPADDTAFESILTQIVYSVSGISVYLGSQMDAKKALLKGITEVKSFIKLKSNLIR